MDYGNPTPAFPLIFRYGPRRWPFATLQQPLKKAPPFFRSILFHHFLDFFSATTLCSRDSTPSRGPLIVTPLLLPRFERRGCARRRSASCFEYRIPASSPPGLAPHVKNLSKIYIFRSSRKFHRERIENFSEAAPRE